MKYQIEKPSDKDLFQSKGHENSAFAIKDTIQNHRDVHIIGLEGTLGAGKSTVLNLLQKQLPSESYKFVTFDVERYHHSSTKASFVKVIHSKLEQFYGPNETLTKAKDLALGNTVTYERKIDSNIHWSTIIFILSMIFTVKFIPDALKPFFDNTIENFSTKHNISIFFTISPLLTLFGIWILNVPKIKRFCSQVFPLKWLSSVPKIGNIIKRNSEDKITEKLLINKEVGSTELEKAFYDFISVIPESDTVILVIDNLDRVDGTKVREIWSDLEIFTSLCGDKLRIIVPYSETHIASALSGDSEKDGQEFISKRIPVVFRAPPVVSAGWREPFKKFWDETLTEGREGLEHCCELIDTWISFNGQVTPRFLKKHVNDIASIVLSNKEIRPSSVACSAYLLAYKTGNVSLQFLLSNNPEPNQKFGKPIHNTQRILRKSLTNEEWATQIMCIHYQSSEDIARSELLDEPIRTSINNIDSRKLINISKMFGFKEAFNKIMSSEEPYNLVHVLNNLLDHDEIDSSEKDAWIESNLPLINHSLKENRDNIDIKHFDSELIDSYENIIKNTISIDTSRLVREANLLENHLKTNKELAKKDEFISNLHDYCKIIKTTPSHIRNLSADDYIQILWPNRENFHQWDIKDIRSHNLQITKNIEFINETVSHEDNISYFEHLKNRKKLSVTWTELDGIELNELVNINRGYILFPFSDYWHEQEHTPKLIPHVISYAESKEYFNGWLSSLISFLITHENYSNQIRISTGQNVIPQDYLEEYIAKSEELEMRLCNDLTFVPQFSKIIKALEYSKFSEFISDPIKTMIKSKKISAIDVKSITTLQWPLLSELFKNGDKASLLSWFEAWSTKLPNVSHWHVELVNDAINEGNSTFLDKMDEYINEKKLGIDFWKDELCELSDTFIALINWVVIRNRKIPDSSSLCNALLDLYSEESYKTIPIDKEFLLILLTSLAKNSKDKLIRNLRSYIENKDFSHKYIYFIIDNFSQHISLPDSMCNEYSEHTLLLFDHIDNENVASWFDSQSWNLSTWNAEHTESFVNTVRELEQSYNVPNLTQLADSVAIESRDESDAEQTE